MYCTPTDFDSHHHQTGEPCNYEAMRAEVAETYFASDSNFDVFVAIDPDHFHQALGNNLVTDESQLEPGHHATHDTSDFDGGCGENSD